MKGIAFNLKANIVRVSSIIILIKDINNNDKVNVITTLRPIDLWNLMIPNSIKN